MTILPRFSLTFKLKNEGDFYDHFTKVFSLTFLAKKNEGDFYDHFTKVLALLFG